MTLSFWKHSMKNAWLLLINVFTNICKISLCKPSVATITLWPLVPTPFSCKTSFATGLSCKLQTFSWKPSNVTPQSQAFSCKFSFATLQSQPLCCNLLLVTIQPQPFIYKLLEVFICIPSVSPLHFQSFSAPNFSVPSRF